LLDLGNLGVVCCFLHSLSITGMMPLPVIPDIWWDGYSFLSSQYPNPTEWNQNVACGDGSHWPLSSQAPLPLLTPDSAASPPNPTLSLPVDHVQCGCAFPRLSFWGAQSSSLLTPLASLDWLWGDNLATTV
jgi:hypothetical protein